MTYAITSAGILRQQLATAKPLLVPGGATPIEAKCAIDAGFSSFYMSGYAAAAWRSGLPDMGLTGLAEIVEAVSVVTSSLPPTIPVFVDADTGYGGVSNVARTVQLLESAGAAAIQIEDQVWPKRCGHMEGKTVIGLDEMVLKVRAAVRSRQDPETVIIARTDACAPMGISEATARGRAFHDAGADLVFVDAPESVAHLEQIASEIPGPLVVNMAESGKTPLFSASELGDMGFSVVLYPTSALRVAAQVMTEMFVSLHKNGSTEAWLDRMMSLDALNDLVGLSAIQEFEQSVLDQI
jgi:2-methylisocitrate lyase-like PEP mutase family enzyme